MNKGPHIAVNQFKWTEEQVLVIGKGNAILLLKEHAIHV